MLFQTRSLFATKRGIAGDLDEVRNALGYKRINIAAASYGTLAAQVYIRKYPQHVRSAFLVGVVTPGFKLPLPFARAAQNALEHLFQDCAADDLIVLDLSMPVMNGLEAAHILRRTMPEIPLILFSNFAEILQEADARSAGISAVVSKDQDVSILVSTAQNLLYQAAA